MTHPLSDELDYAAVDQPVLMHDPHATPLRLLDMDHERLTVRVQGRDDRLTDVHGQAVWGILSWVGWVAPGALCA